MKTMSYHLVTNTTDKGFKVLCGLEIDVRTIGKERLVTEIEGEVTCPGCRNLLNKKSEYLIEECLRSFEGDKHLEKVFLYKIKQGCSIDDARITALKTSLIDDSDINVSGHEIFDTDGFKSLANQLK